MAMAIYEETITALKTAGFAVKPAESLVDGEFPSE